MWKHQPFNIIPTLCPSFKDNFNSAINLFITLFTTSYILLLWCYSDLENEVVKVKRVQLNVMCVNSVLVISFQAKPYGINRFTVDNLQGFVRSW